jgi:hypothetical protein
MKVHRWDWSDGFMMKPWFVRMKLTKDGAYLAMSHTVIANSGIIDVEMGIEE